MRPLSRVTTCIACAAPRVFPLDCAERRHGWWWLSVRCGECGMARQLVVDDAEAGRFESDLEDAAEEIAEALWAFERECMLAEARCWAKALALDLVDARDFAQRRR